jgi:MFS family permease
VLFAVSFGFAVLGVGAIGLLLPAGATHGTTAPTAAGRGMFAALVDRRFAAVVVAGSALGLATISDSFIFLTLQRRLAISATAFPIFYVATSLFTAMFAWVCGRAADRFGRRRIMLGGYALLAGVYALLLAFPSAGIAMACLTLALLGGYYAATDGVITALAAGVLPAHHRGSGLALLATSTNVARLLASVAFGWMWTVYGVESAIAISLLGLIAAMGGTVFLIRRVQ